MKTTYTKLRFLILSALTAGLTIGRLNAVELSSNDKQFLAQYEKVRAALAADDFPAAKNAAADLKEDGAPIANSDQIANARKEFATLSDQAIKLAAGQSGYYVVRCPMLKKDWVQTSEKISNPYAGREMATCGSIKK